MSWLQIWLVVLAVLVLAGVLAVVVLDAPVWVILAAAAPPWIAIRVLRYRHFRSRSGDREPGVVP